MPISNIELTDNFSVWRDNFNLTVNKVNDSDLKITDYETTGGCFDDCGYITNRKYIGSKNISRGS